MPTDRVHPPYVALSAVPDDLPGAIRTAKAALRAGVGDVAAVLADVEAAMAQEVAAIVASRAAGEPVWPVVTFDDVAAGAVGEAMVAAIHRRGCVVVKGTFRREQAERWDGQLAEYVDGNDFDAAYRRPEWLPEGVRPSIIPIYWSKPQVEARQDARMVAVRTFLNGLWRQRSEGRAWFDPSRDIAYPDRVRRRPPGQAARGLPPHVDSGTIERWLLPAYQRVYRHVFSGHWRRYDPWDPAHRTDAHEYPSGTMCSAFRTFQGWTALSDMQPTDGVLHVIPVPHAMVHLLLRPLADDVHDDELCGASHGRSITATERYHAVLLPGLTPIPAVEPGDTVWWHGDLVHSVEPAANDDRWSNVMYIPAAPWCEKNAASAAASAEAFARGASPFDFPVEDYEVGWTGRATTADLDATGRRQFGLDPW